MDGSLQILVGGICALAHDQSHDGDEWTRDGSDGGPMEQSGGGREMDGIYGMQVSEVLHTHMQRLGRD